MALFYPHMLDAPPCPALPSALQQMKAFWLPSLALLIKTLLELPNMLHALPKACPWPLSCRRGSALAAQPGAQILGTAEEAR